MSERNAEEDFAHAFPLEENKSFLKKWGRWLVIAGLLLAVLLMFLFWFRFFYDTAGNFKSLSGTLHLTLQKTPDKQNYLTGLYTYSLERNNLDIFLNDGMHINTTADVSRDGEDIVFAEVSLQSIADGQPPSAQVTTLDLTTRERNTVTSSQEPAIKQLPQWSPDKSQIVFMAKASDVTREGAITPAGVWGVYVTDMQGNERLVASGTHPHWLPDGERIVALDTDGVYVHNLERGESTRVIPIQNGLAYSNMKMDLSDDGSLLAISNVQRGEITIFRMHSWEEPEYELITEYETHAFWPTFSPDGTYLAVQEVDLLEGELINPRLVVYHIESGKKEVLRYLNEYVQTSMFISDWTN